MDFKRVFLTFILLFTAVIFYADDSRTLPAMSSGFEIFLNNAIGENISVTISNVDNTITGKLLNVYTDGIYLQTAFNNFIFIRNESIAYVRISSRR